MGFDLKPRNKSADAFSMGAFSWCWMLDNGVGLPVGYGPGFSPGSFIYRNRPDGLCIGYNDGARVTSAEAKEMAKVARWVADYQDDLYAEWMKEPEDRRQKMQNEPTRLYKLPVRRDFVEKVRAFAEWAEKSGGFTVH
jgi:hypothetical protein